MNNRNSSEEKRKFKRINVNFIVTYKVNSPLTVRIKYGDQEIDAVALDVSEEGIGVLTNCELPASTLITIKFVMFNDAAISVEQRRRALKVNGEVRYCVFLTKEKSYRVGVRFIDITSDDRRFINNFVKMVK